VRSRAVALAAVAALAALGSALPASAQGTAPAQGIHNPTGAANVTLYFHVNGFQEFPINTQRPTDWHQDEGKGLATSSASCAGILGPTPYGREHHTWYGYSSPGYVEYDFTPDGQPRTHPERGLSYDVEFGAESFDLYWYLSTQTGAPGALGVSPDQAPVVIPGVVVRATIRQGSEVTVDGSGYNTGEIVAQGASEPATFAMQASTGAKHAEVDGHHVYEVRVPMRTVQDKVPKEGGYSLRIDAFVENPACEDPSTAGYLMPNLVKVHTSPDFRPRMELQVLEAVRIESIHPQAIQDDLVVHASVNSPFGNYDVDEGTLRAEVRDDDGALVATLPPATVVQRYHEHDHHTEAVDVAFVWPYREGGAKEGAYVFTVVAANDQGTAAATATVPVDLGDVVTVTACNVESGSSTCREELQDRAGNVLGEPKGSPAASLGVVVTVGLASALARRRRGPR
jgi:hypothetical protein